MGCHYVDELSRGNRLSFLPELRKMTLISGDQVVGARRIGAL
jgi:hypothetical protein